MNDLKHNFLIGIFAVVFFMFLGLLGLNVIESRPFSAAAKQEENGYLPVIMGEADNMPSPTATSENPPTSTPTATPTFTPTPTNTPTPTPTFTPTPTPTRDPRSPNINSLTADTSTILAGGSTYLRWSISNTVESLELAPGGFLELESDKVQVSPSEMTTYTLTASNEYGFDTADVVVDVQIGQELLVYDWDKDVLKKHHGFPHVQPPRANGDWTSPVDFANGTLELQVVVNSIPEDKNMRLQFCFWQLDDLSIENCTREKDVLGTAGNSVSWSIPMRNLLKIKGEVDYSQPRKRVAAVIKNSEGLPVSDYLDFNWGGEDPDKWYPLDWRFTVVVVADGVEFSGWENYNKD